MNFSIELIKNLFKFNEEELGKIKKFTSLLNHAVNSDSNFNIDEYYRDFIKLLERHKKLKRKTYFFDFVKPNTDFFEELIKYDVLKYIFEYSKNNNTTISFCSLIDHIIVNFDRRSIMIENMSQLQQLDFESICYVYDSKHFEEVSKYVEVYEIGKRDDQQYLISSFFTDGEVNWNKELIDIEYEVSNQFFETQTDGYIASVESPNYMLYYTKGTNIETIKSLYLNRLDFDTKTLPSYNELYSMNENQKLGNDETEAINNINTLISNCSVLRANVQDIERILSQLKGTERYEQALILSKKLCNIMEVLTVILANSYQKDNIISEETLQKIIRR